MLVYSHIAMEPKLKITKMLFGCIDIKSSTHHLPFLLLVNASIFVEKEGHSKQYHLSFGEGNPVLSKGGEVSWGTESACRLLFTVLSLSSTVCVRILLIWGHERVSAQGITSQGLTHATCYHCQIWVRLLRNMNHAKHWYWLWRKVWNIRMTGLWYRFTDREGFHRQIQRCKSCWKTYPLPLW